MSKIDLKWICKQLIGDKETKETVLVYRYSTSQSHPLEILKPPLGHQAWEKPEGNRLKSLRVKRIVELMNLKVDLESIDYQKKKTWSLNCSTNLENDLSR